MSKGENGISSKASDMLHQAALRIVRRTLQRGLVTIDTERCKGCELCVYECPAHTLKLSKGVNAKGFHSSEQVKPEACIGCASCALICPDACITVFRHSRIPHSPIQNN